MLNSIIEFQQIFVWKKYDFNLDYQVSDHLIFIPNLLLHSFYPNFQSNFSSIFIHKFLVVKFLFQVSGWKIFMVKGFMSNKFSSGTVLRNLVFSVKNKTFCI